MNRAYEIAEKLISENNLTEDELLTLIENIGGELRDRLYRAASRERDGVYGRLVFMRGLIEFSNHCKNDCLYCGLRRSNCGVHRYRLTPEQIIECCENGHEMGFRSFVLQSGEDSWYSDDVMCDTVREIRRRFPESAITLSVGEKSLDTYRCYFNAGADRYLLRHETADDKHYSQLHPSGMLLSTRMQCLKDLRSVGFQVGAGFMVGAPYQTARHLAKDLVFLKSFNPHMVGIGPFIPQSATPFAHEKAGTVQQTLDMVALTRLLLPEVLLPATTALGTLDLDGREYALNAGANVVMPNLSPKDTRKDYAIYDNKISTGEEAAETRFALEERLISAGYVPSYSRGDHSSYKQREYRLSEA
jgi:biotin synthase